MMMKDSDVNGLQFCLVNRCWSRKVLGFTHCLFRPSETGYYCAACLSVAAWKREKRVLFIFNMCASLHTSQSWKKKDLNPLLEYKSLGVHVLYFLFVYVFICSPFITGKTSEYVKYNVILYCGFINCKYLILKPEEVSVLQTSRSRK